MTQVWEGCPGSTHVSVDPEPTAGRKPPALLVFLFLLGAVGTGLSCPSSFARTLNLVVIPWVLFGASDRFD
jgi:hypothetical protein